MVVDIARLERDVLDVLFIPISALVNSHIDWSGAFMSKRHVNISLPVQASILFLTTF